MTYLTLSAVFLVLAGAVALALMLVGRRRPHGAAVALTLLALLLLTAVFDTVMIATGLFHYAPEQLVGLHVGLAPIEDFAYPLAGAILLPALWVFLRARRERRASSSAGRGDA
jgi:lycopene cyclase domain-containing protein